jgi:hypothetical protein
VVDHLPSKCKASSSNPSTANDNKKTTLGETKKFLEWRPVQGGVEEHRHHARSWDKAGAQQVLCEQK